MDGLNTTGASTNDTEDGVNKNMCPHCEEHFSRTGGCLSKWIFMIIAGSIFLGLLMWSKVSFLCLAEAMHDGQLGVQARCRIFVMLQIIICVPNVLNFIRGVWNGVLRTDVQWKIYLAVIVFSLLETAGMCIFTFIIPGFIKMTHSIILPMSCMFLFPTMSNLITKLTNKRETKTYKWCNTFWPAFITLGAFAIMNYRLWSDNQDRKERVTFTYVSVVVLSLVWTPSLRRMMRDQFKQKLCRNARNASVWKLTAVMSFCNIVFTIVWSLITFGLMDLRPVLYANETNDVTWQNYSSGWDWKDEWKEASGHEILLFVTHIISGIAGYMVACMICKAHLHKTSFLIPLIVSAPVAFLVLSWQGPCHWLLARKGSATHSEYSPEWHNLMDGAAIFCFALAHVLISGLKFYKTDFLRHLTEEQIYRIPAFNSIFLDQWLLLNAQNKEDDSDEHIDAKEAAKRQKIFICTTMYRETAQEMKQFIKSIQNLENRSELKTEVHILFDDAIEDNTSNELVTQLVTQIKTILYTELPRTSNADQKVMLYEVCETPYGKCLSFKEDRKIPIIIHLKDSLKVKKKKRWSQVMYMNYVLHRLAKTETDAEQSSTTTADADDEQRPLQAGDNQNEKHPIIEEGLSETRGLSKCCSCITDLVTLMKLLCRYFVFGSAEKTKKPVACIAPDMDSYLLVTDADVSFTSDSVGYLLDLVMRDDTLGAACVRTHPRGSGPLYWYQIFEYAVGHWFQKAAEQVLGTVLCAPGCFSIYRCKAVRKVLSDYSTDVEEAFDFLIKDMGEDRWFCTLMVKEGWFIEYCAAARNETFCPDNFAEFFKQRRRWLISTVANMWLLLKDWSKIRKNNNHVSVLFGIYQAMLLFASLISPSSTILLISGGIKYGWDWDVVTTITLQVIVSVAFGLVCLFTSQDTQIKVVKLLTFVYAIMMTSVAVGLAVAITSDFISPPELDHELDHDHEQNDNFISDHIRISTFAVFLSAVVGMFLLSGMLHIKELGSLIHGLWFFLCIPTGYLLLPIYCLCNMTDKSWGTREVQTLSDNAAKVKWLNTIKNAFSCCWKKDVNEETNRQSISSSGLVSDACTEDSSNRENQTAHDEENTLADLGIQALTDLDEDEKEFWISTIKEKGLDPRHGLKGLKQDLSEPLAELRKSWILVFATANSLWLTFIATLANEGKILNILGSNPVGLVVLCILLILLIIQFIAMLKHRLLTLVHHVGRLSFCTCDKDKQTISSNQPEPKKKSGGCPCFCKKRNNAV